MPAKKLLAAPIERRAVNSTSIAGIGYHARLQVLEIAFRSGALYRYVAVPPAVFEALMKAESKGRYFTQHIRNRFEFHRLEDSAHEDDQGRDQADHLHRAGRARRRIREILPCHSSAADDEHAACPKAAGNPPPALNG